MLHSKDFTGFSHIVYNDGREGHTEVKAEILELHENFMLVQFEDRADTTTIYYSDAEWMNYIKPVNVKPEHISKMPIDKIFPIGLEVVTTTDSKRNPWTVSGYVNGANNIVVIRHADGKEIQCHTKNLKRRFSSK